MHAMKPGTRRPVDCCVVREQCAGFQLGGRGVGWQDSPSGPVLRMKVPFFLRWRSEFKYLITWFTRMC